MKPESGELEQASELPGLIVRVGWGKLLTPSYTFAYLSRKETGCSERRKKIKGGVWVNSGARPRRLTL